MKNTAINNKNRNINNAAPEDSVVDFDSTNELFEIRKTFGLGVLLKLTKKNVKGIEIETMGDRFVSNVSLSKMKDAVESTMESHNILVKV